EDDTPEPVIIAGVDSDRKWVELVNYSNEEITLTGWSLLAVWKGAQMGYCPIKGSVKLPPHGKIKVKSDLPVRRDSVNLSLLDSNLEERSIISYALVDVTDV
ncbi:unnamed protein product, partial [Heligmosomoides polygyrus]|uniref:LTD domain-containing protein n=1 Tax=Heligmosomoides polygyrus TaxID=6339 RepID=A0A183GC02_HELPZ